MIRKLLLVLLLTACSAEDVKQTTPLVEIPEKYRGVWQDYDNIPRVWVTNTDITFTTFDGEIITESVKTKMATTDWYFDFIGSNDTKISLTKFTYNIMSVTASRQGKEIQENYYKFKSKL